MNLRGDDADLKALLAELQDHVAHSKRSFLGKYSSTYLKDNINTLMRQVAKYFQATQTKECCYVFYWFLLSIMWNVEQLGKMTNQYAEQACTKDLHKKFKDVEEKLREGFQSQIEDMNLKRKSEIAEIEQKHIATKQRLKELEQEIEIKEQDYSNRMSEIATSPVIEGLEQTYGRMREAIRQTYDNEMQ